MKKHPLLPLQHSTLSHIAQGQLIEQSRFESVFNLVRTTSAGSLRRGSEQVYENYAVRTIVYIFMLSDFYVTDF